MSEMIARRYARAIFELAREQNLAAQVTRELETFAEAYATSQDLRELDMLPSLTSQDRKGVVTALAQRLGASDLTARAVGMLAARRRLALLPDLVHVLNGMADEHLGTLRGQVASATVLDEAYKAELQRAIEKATGKRVQLTFDVDPSLIAGIVTQIGDQVIDGSVRGKLNDLATSIRQG